MLVYKLIYSKIIAFQFIHNTSRDKYEIFNTFIFGTLFHTLKPHGTGIKLPAIRSALASLLIKMYLVTCRFLVSFILQADMGNALLLILCVGCWRNKNLGNHRRTEGLYQQTETIVQETILNGV